MQKHDDKSEVLAIVEVTTKESKAKVWKRLYLLLFNYSLITLFHFTYTKEFVVNAQKLIEIIIFAIALSSLFLLTSYASGWNKLAQSYKTEQSPPIDLLNEQSGKIEDTLTKNALNIGVSEQGLYLSTNIVFSFFNMPPLLIPWEDITHVSSDNNSFFGEGYQLDIGTPIITTLILPKTALKKAETILATKQ